MVHANWTFRTFGQYVEALDGELEIIVHAMEDPLDQPRNYDAYLEYDSDANLFTCDSYPKPSSRVPKKIGGDASLITIHN